MITRFSIAFDDAWNVESPTWTRIDSTYTVQRVTITRGRDFEMDVHDAGRATVTFLDKTGAFDPLYVSGTYYGKTVPFKQAKIELVNPVSSAVSTIFRGFVDSWRFEPHPTEKFNTVTVNLVDGMAIVAGCELLPNATLFGDDVVAGNIVYNADSALTAVRTRIVQVLDEIGWPGTTATDTLRAINSGNVGLWDSTYAPRTSALTVIQEAAEADFPAVSGGFYFAKDGKATFMGRYTRIDPTNPDYGIQTWELGDDAAAAADPTVKIPVSPPLVFYVDSSQMFNVATCTNQETADADIPSQVDSDATSISAYGRRSWSAEGLRTRNGSGPTTADAECQLFSEFMVGNYKDPAIRVEAITVRPRMPGRPYATKTWALMCGVELNDIVELTHTMKWGGGFAGNQYFVERISYDIEMANDTIDDVTLTLDVSPGEYYTSNPFAGP